MSEDERYYADMRSILEPAYLAADTLQRGSGFSGDAVRWRRARKIIADAMPHDGTFLDIGLANGLLMESVAEWAAERGVRIEPHGLDISPPFIEAARARLPRWAERMYLGNVIDWLPPKRFDYVRTELVYVPESRRVDLVQRIVDDLLTSGGRVIICSYGSSRRPEPKVEPIGDWLRQHGFAVSHEDTAYELNGVAVTGIACVDRPAG